MRLELGLSAAMVPGQPVVHRLAALRARAAFRDAARLARLARHADRHTAAYLVSLAVRLEAALGARHATDTFLCLDPADRVRHALHLFLRHHPAPDFKH